jgi:hypothetical protein
MMNSAQIHYSSFYREVRVDIFRTADFAPGFSGIADTDTRQPITEKCLRKVEKALAWAGLNQ